MVICPDCGREVPKDKFCKNCGAYIADIEEINQIPQETGEIKRGYDVPASSHSDIKFCHNCGYGLIRDFKFCPNCGENLNSTISKSNIVHPSDDKNMLLAIILSVFLPGLGQIYLGLDNKGAIFLIAYVVSAILILILIGFLLCFIIWIWALIDTIISTNALNRGEEVKDKLL